MHFSHATNFREFPRVG